MVGSNTGTCGSKSGANKAVLRVGVSEAPTASRLQDKL